MTELRPDGIHAVQGRRTAHQRRTRPITEPILPGFPDLGQNSFSEHSAREGVPRLPGLTDKHDIKITVLMTGQAARRQPRSPRRSSAAVTRQTRTAAAGNACTSYPVPKKPSGSPDSVRTIQDVTSTRPAGYNNYRIRPGVNTLEILQEPGCTYHTGDLSAGGPFLQRINGQPFATVPYKVHLNDITSPGFPGCSPAGYQQQLLDEFNQVYPEGREPAPFDGHQPA